MNTFSKLSILLVTLLITTTTFSQEIFIKKSIDGSMALNLNPNDNYEFAFYNTEISFGFEWDHDRALGGIELADAINYRKWFLEYDKKLTSGIFSFYAGVEFGGIWRWYDIDLTNFNHTTEVQVHSFTIGANFETQFKVLDWLWLTANLNIFTSENDDYSEIHEFFRYDVMGGVVFKTGI